MRTTKTSTAFGPRFVAARTTVMVCTLALSLAVLAKPELRAGLVGTLFVCGHNLAFGFFVYRAYREGHLRRTVPQIYEHFDNLERSGHSLWQDWQRLLEYATITAAAAAMILTDRA